MRWLNKGMSMAAAAAKASAVQQPAAADDDDDDDEEVEELREKNKILLNVRYAFNSPLISCV
jgi:ribosomal protein L12E/L44/L45/RPP1/RPP2